MNTFAILIVGLEIFSGRDTIKGFFIEIYCKIIFIFVYWMMGLLLICEIEKKYTWFISMHIRYRSGRLPFWFILSELTTSQKISAAPHFTVKCHAYKKWGELSACSAKIRRHWHFQDMNWIGMQFTSETIVL